MINDPHETEVLVYGKGNIIWTFGESISLLTVKIFFTSYTSNKKLINKIYKYLKTSRKQPIFLFKMGVVLVKISTPVKKCRDNGKLV